MIEASGIHTKFIVKQGYLVPLIPISDSLLDQDELESKFTCRTLTSSPLININSLVIPHYADCPTTNLMRNLEISRDKRVKSAPKSSCKELWISTSTCMQLKERNARVKLYTSIPDKQCMDKDSKSSSSSVKIFEQQSESYLFDRNKDFQENLLNNSIILNILCDIDNYPTFISYIRGSPLRHKESIVDIVAFNFHLIISKKSGPLFFLETYQICRENRIQLKLLNNCDMVSSSKSQSFLSLISIVNAVYSISSSDADFVYSKFNDLQIWSSLSRHKHGKNVVENFIKSFYNEENTKHKHSLLIGYILSNFLELGQANYTTFVVQAFIISFKDLKVIELIFLHFNEFCLTRNGVFLIIAALKTCQNTKILDLILSKSEKLCSGQYTSTLMEYVFKTYTEYAASRFVHTKLAYILSKSAIL